MAIPNRRCCILAAASAILAAIAYWFWAFPYRAALSYREQFQLFQTTDTYFMGLAARPAGIATYIGEFLTQFFNNYWIGAAIITFLLLCVLLLTYQLTKRFAPSSSKYTRFVLSLIPLIALWLYLGNANVLMAFVVALLFAMTAAVMLISCKRFYLTILIATPILYWMVGPITILFTLLAIAYYCIRTSSSIGNKIVFSLISIAWLIANVCIWASFVFYPLSYQMIGIGYLLTPDTLSTGQIIVEALCLIVPIAAIATSKITQRLAIPVIIIAEVAAVIILFPKSYDKITYQLINYDYLVRANDWEEILRYSDKHNPDLPMSVCATNLALGMTGQLDSRAFAYFQHGAEGLIPPFVKEPLSSWTTGETLFQLGMVNSAQRFYFEGMEAIPNYNKSSRAMRRMAETAMIRGEYALAEKYLHILENTLFYRKWAQRNLALIKDPAGIDNHPLYGHLRARMVDEEYMFSEGELDKTFGQLFLKDPNNNLAKQYLVVYPLLQRDLNKFVQYMGVVAESQPTYNPPLAQQAMAFMSMKSGQQIPKGAVQPGVEELLRNFAQAWTSKDPARIESFRHTLYYYLVSSE